MNNRTQPPRMRVAVVGGGIMGVTLAYKLSQRDDLDITIYERGGNLGGLAAFMWYDGVRMDRFYHTILSSDLSMQALIQESGVADRLHFTETKQGFFDSGQIYPFNTPIDLMTYPPLNIFQRFRLGLQVLYAQLESDWRKMDNVSVEDWLVKVSGRAVYEKVWKPLLRAKFDTAFTDVPATYIWSRLKRMMGTRQGVTSKEMMCFLENGYYTLIEAMAEQCVQRGVTICVDTAIEQIVIENGRAVGVRTPDGLQPFDVVISTLVSPLLAKLIPDAPEAFQRQLAEQEYLGVLCPVLILKQQLIPYYVLNITDETIPFTGVVETTNLIDPKYVKNYHLVYLPKYVAPDNPMYQWPDDQVKNEWMKHFLKMFPDFDESQIVDFIVQRARYVEPIRPLGTTDQIPHLKTPVEGLYMGNTAMIHPDLGNGDAAARFAYRIIDQVLADLPAWTPQPVPVA
ncbi:MAG: NAD(P)/FAD-dependent oxidoreductase [Anaerolineae bacterium]|nr:NAD(P)/FAD-dependent oxidoreductase [Anaerolineae bacterium]